MYGFVAQIIGSTPALTVSKLKSFAEKLNLSVGEVNALNLPPDVKTSALAYLKTC
jgi:hypothetical protein